MRDFSRKSLLLFLMLVIASIVACNPTNDTTTVGKNSHEKQLKIVTTIAQIGEPLAVIGGDRVTVESLMGPAVDPHVYNATQSDLQKLNEADIIFYNGLNLEANMVEMFTKIGETKPVMAFGEQIDRERLLTDEDGALDPHIWFHIDLWQEALAAAVELLKESSPEDAAYFEANKKEYFAQLETLKEEAKVLQEIPQEKRYLITAHDAFGYFGAMHGIEVIGLQGLSTEDEIGVSDIHHVIELIEQYKVPAIFLESTINPNSIEAVKEGAKERGIDVTIGGELYSDAMGEPGTAAGTYIGMYRHNVETIYEALMGGEPN